MSSEILYVHEELVHNKRAARAVLPHVFQFIKPASVLDVGCGLGTWLSVCEELGVRDCLGIDGDYVDMKKLAIPLAQFRTFDLRKAFNLSKKFDLVISLEVAEHLPESSADDFVKSLVAHGDTILFSAAIPGQGGQNHINEQWPEYWQSKFNQHGFYFHDVIRPEIWADPAIDIWYRQNMFMVKREKPSSRFVLSAVHPELFNMHISIKDEYISSLTAGKHGVKASFLVFFNSLKVKLKSLLGMSS
jgi:SAM-dependent methyltransferase